MTTAPPPAEKRAGRSAFNADALAPLARRRLATDLMSVSFAIAVRSATGCVATEDARRVGMARHVTAARLRYCGLHAMVDDATLVVSELVTSAILHSGGAQITFTLAVSDDVLRLAVRDEMPGGPAVCVADSESERGRGLRLVDCVARQYGGKWGSADDGATVYCDLALTGVPQ
ncbi:ATP-binding protein [Streptomyces sp. NPDC059168]|uniref:ATP-binding protein n=1 Tax=Streptomyces sp. NPDC059168 TaxID=3346753 RepID=UPI00367C0060